MKLNVNPNRMELTRLKKRLVTAKRGHKLLKDKQDELMRRFIELVRRNNQLRDEMEAAIMAVYRRFVLASAATSPSEVEEALMMPKETVSLETTTQNIMSVIVPKFQFRIGSGESDLSDIYPYGFMGTSHELDLSVAALYDLLPKLLELGEVEKTCNLMTDEIEKTRRRVNALEYMTIPRLLETIKFIRMKLDENERGNLTRLMKVKDMMMKQQSEAAEAAKG